VSTKAEKEALIRDLKKDQVMMREIALLTLFLYHVIVDIKKVKYEDDYEIVYKE
jgi:hypothetical protein